MAEYVIDANITRRNMSTGARAMATALVLDADGRRNDGRWKRGAVYDGNPSDQNRNTWREKIAQAGIVLGHAPQLAEQVVNDKLALDNAYKQACEARDAQRKKLAEKERLAAEEADASAS